jgi:hypothetical protein
MVPPSEARGKVIVFSTRAEAQNRWQFWRGTEGLERYAEAAAIIVDRAKVAP